MQNPHPLSYYLSIAYVTQNGMGVCETTAKLVIKQNNAPPDSFSRIYLCPFKQNKEKPFWTRLLPGYEVENDGIWLNEIEKKEKM